MLIRDFRHSDFNRILEIERESFEYPWPPSVFLRVRRMGARIIVAEISEEVVGFAIFRVESGIEKIGHLMNIAVDPSYRRRGIGSALLREFERRCFKEGARYVYLEVRASNKAAQEFYRKWGYKVVGIKRAYYSNGEDACIMAKYLSAEETTTVSCGESSRLGISLRLNSSFEALLRLY